MGMRKDGGADAESDCTSRAVRLRFERLYEDGRTLGWVSSFGRPLRRRSTKNSVDSQLLIVRWLERSSTKWVRGVTILTRSRPGPALKRGSGRFDSEWIREFFRCRSSEYFVVVPSCNQRSNDKYQHDQNKYVS
jgi:hypothetical protein